jgi:hypothetical protein
MYFRLEKSGPRSYLQIVESRWENGRPRQYVIATIGRADELARKGALAALLASGARFCAPNPFPSSSWTSPTSRISRQSMNQTGFLMTESSSTRAS